jgi:hypothetical protein
MKKILGVIIFVIATMAYGQAQIGSGGNGQTTIPDSVTKGTVAADTMIADIANAIYGVSQFGVKCDGSTDDSTALNAIGTFAAGISGKTVTVQFPSNATCVHSSAITTWLNPSLHVIGNGVRLHFTGSGQQIYLHSTTTEVDNFWMMGFTLQGNPNATYGILGDSTMARGRIQIDNIQDFSTACAEFDDAQLMDIMDISCSYLKAKSMGVRQSTTPRNGVLLGKTNFANNRNVNLTIEGVGPGIGVNCLKCTNGDVFTGTSEGNAGIGLQLSAISSGIIFNGFDLEANGTSFVDLSGGNFHSFGSVGIGTNLGAGSGFFLRLALNRKNQWWGDGTMSSSGSANDMGFRNDHGCDFMAAGGSTDQFTLCSTGLTLTVPIKAPSTSTFGGAAASKLLANCGTMTTTAATTNRLACSWVTASSNCTVTQNSTAIIVPWTAVVPTSGTVTVTHAATAGATYAIACSAN